jgi:putative flavoprotein involved in K+ transport
MSTQTDPTADRGQSTARPEYFETVIIGGGQAGLAIGYHLSRRGHSFVILDASERVGDSWRGRWDSMRLFTPAGHDALPGLPFPAPAWSFPGKDEMADYLEAYAARLELPVMSGVRVDALSKRDERFMIAAGSRRFEADQVVIACGSHPRARIPSFAPELDPRIVQLHSSHYRNPAQLCDGDALVVGAGNSGADIALELASDRRTWLSGRHPGHIPIRIESRRARALFPVIWFAWSHVLTVRNPLGRKVRRKLLSSGDPLIRVKPRDLLAAGVERVGRTVGVKDGLPVLDDGRVMGVSNVVWCTGFQPEFDWIDLAAFECDDEPPTARGVVDLEPGLYLLGREFLHAFNSHTIGGVERDAAHIAQHIASRR